MNTFGQEVECSAEPESQQEDLPRARCGALSGYQHLVDGRPGLSLRALLPDPAASYLSEPIPGKESLSQLPFRKEILIPMQEKLREYRSLFGRFCGLVPALQPGDRIPPDTLSIDVDAAGEL